MSDAFWIAGFGFLSSIGLGILAFMTVIYKQGKETKKQSEETHRAVNSRMDELLEIAKSASRAEGKVEGIAEQKAENGK